MPASGPKQLRLFMRESKGNEKERLLAKNFAKVGFQA